MGFPTKNDHFGVFWGYHHLRKHPNVVGVFIMCVFVSGKKIEERIRLPGHHGSKPQNDSVEKGG